MTGSVDASFVGPEAYIILVTLSRKKKDTKISLQILPNIRPCEQSKHPLSVFGLEEKQVLRSPFWDGGGSGLAVTSNRHF